MIETAEDLTVPAIVAALDAGETIHEVARRAGTTPLGLIVAGVQWAAGHRGTITDAEHSRVCAVLWVAAMTGAVRGSLPDHAE